MSGGIACSRLLSAEHAVAVKIHRGIRHGISRTVGDESAYGALSQEAHVGHGDLASGGECAGGTSTISRAVGGLDRESTQRNKVEEVLSLAVGGCTQEFRSRESYVDAASDRSCAVASEGCALDRA